MKDMFPQYGKAKELQEILEELAIFCGMSMANPDNVRVILPRKVIDAFSLSMYAKERVVIPNTLPLVSLPTLKMYCCEGNIYLHSLEENEEAIKGLV